MATHTSQLASSSLSARNGATRDKVRPRGESASPRRASTLPPLLSEMSAVPHKRIVVCCDGYVVGVNCLRPFQHRLHRTWQDGIVVDARWKYTNVLVRVAFFCLCCYSVSSQRLSRAINHVDDRVYVLSADTYYILLLCPSTQSLWASHLSGRLLSVGRWLFKQSLRSDCGWYVYLSLRRMMSLTRETGATGASLGKYSWHSPKSHELNMICRRESRGGICLHCPVGSS